LWLWATWVALEVCLCLICLTSTIFIAMGINVR
jgi:hypothetical protein